MSETVKKTDRNASIVAKAGLWYTVCNFLFKGMAFITTPLFARLMSKSELGGFANFSAWASVLLVLTSFDLAQSIIRSKLEFENDIDCYAWSILSFTTIWTLFVYGVFLIFPGLFTQITNIDAKYLHLMFWYLLTSPAYTMLITKHRAFYKYKMFVLLTGIMMGSGTILSVTLVFLMENKLTGRLIGYYSPFILFGLGIFILIAVRGKRIKTAYWKYASVIMLPLVPHVLSLYLLSISDTMIITRLCGAEYTAIYSIAYSAYHIVTILFDSMNKAWAPWLLEKLHAHDYDEIKKVSRVYVLIFEMIILLVLMVVPEIILILGGSKYLDAIYCLPPLVTGCAFQLVYTMYVNIEFYEKRTFGVSLATMIACAVNIILNFLLIPMNPEHSYIIAAYTTLAGYFVLYVVHYIIVKRMNMTHVYETRFLVGVLAGTMLFAGAMNILYSFTILRYGIVVIYGIAVIVLAVRYMDSIKKIFFRKRKA